MKGQKLELGTWANWFAGSASTAAVIVALRAQSVVARREKVARKRHQIEVGRQVGVKLWRVASLNSSLTGAFDQKPPADFTEEEQNSLWRWMRPPVPKSMDSGLFLTADENNLLVELGENLFLLQLVAATDAYAHLLNSVSLWEGAYARLITSVEFENSEDGKPVGTRDGKQIARLEWVGEQVDIYARHCIFHWKEISEELHMLVDRFNPMIESHLGPTATIQFYGLRRSPSVSSVSGHSPVGTENGIPNVQRSDREEEQ